MNSSSQHDNTNEPYEALEDVSPVDIYESNKNSINEGQNRRLDSQDNEIVINNETKPIATSLIENKTDKKTNKRKFHKKLQLKPNEDLKKGSHRIHPSNSINKKSRDSSRKHMCDTCGKTFITISNLNDHVRIHSGDKPYICPNCGQRFLNIIIYHIIFL